MFKPHEHNGRFYNHRHDSIIGRIANVARTLAHIMRHRIMKTSTKDVLRQAARHSTEWSTICQPPLRSEDPCITWLGHASFLIQVGGFNVITDPCFYELSSVVRRMLPVPLNPRTLPPIDAVMISHNHWDHADKHSLLDLLPHQPVMYVPMGNGAWMKSLGFATVHELTWWEQRTLRKGQASLDIHFLPASHWTGRGLFDINTTLWGSWMLVHDQSTVYFAGDTAYDRHFAAIAQIFKSIDVALLPIGPVEPHCYMAEAHMDAVEVMQALQELGAHHFVPMHWGTFMFGLDDFLTPINQLQQCWQTKSPQLAETTLHLLRCGQSQIFEMKSGDGPFIVPAQRTDMDNPPQLSL